MPASRFRRWVPFQFEDLLLLGMTLLVEPAIEAALEQATGTLAAIHEDLLAPVLHRVFPHRPALGVLLLFCLALHVACAMTRPKDGHPPRGAIDLAVRRLFLAFSQAPAGMVAVAGIGYLLPDASRGMKTIIWQQLFQGAALVPVLAGGIGAIVGLLAKQGPHPDRRPPLSELKRRLLLTPMLTLSAFLFVRFLETIEPATGRLDLLASQTLFFLMFVLAPRWWAEGGGSPWPWLPRLALFLGALHVGDFV